MKEDDYEFKSTEQLRMEFEAASRRMWIGISVMVALLLLVIALLAS